MISLKLADSIRSRGRKAFAKKARSVRETNHSAAARMEDSWRYQWRDDVEFDNEMVFKVTHSFFPIRQQLLRTLAHGLPLCVMALGIGAMTWYSAMLHRDNGCTEHGCTELGIWGLQRTLAVFRLGTFVGLNSGGSVGLRLLAMEPFPARPAQPYPALRGT